MNSIASIKNYKHQANVSSINQKDIIDAIAHLKLVSIPDYYVRSKVIDTSKSQICVKGSLIHRSYIIAKFTITLTQAIGMSDTYILTPSSSFESRCDDFVCMAKSIYPADSDAILESLTSMSRTNIMMSEMKKSIGDNILYIADRTKDGHYDSHPSSRVSASMHMIDSEDDDGGICTPSLSVLEMLDAKIIINGLFNHLTMQLSER